jgi:hypothetical protein
VSQIPSYPVQPPGYGPPQPMQQSPPGENGMAIAGFVLSIIGFFTCCLTSPVGLILSIIGMKKTDQQGLAIAGLVLGILGTLGFIGMVAYFIVVMVFLGGVAFWAKDTMASHSERIQTVQSINLASAEIERQVSSTRSLPTNSQGTSMISRHRDAWHRTLKYERLGNNRYEIISSGPDKNFGTRDDIKQRHTSSFAMSRRSYQPRDMFAFFKSKQSIAATAFAALPP